MYTYGYIVTDSLLLEMAIEILSFPINSMVIFHTYWTYTLWVSSATWLAGKSPNSMENFRGQSPI